MNNEKLVAQLNLMYMLGMANGYSMREKEHEDERIEEMRKEFFHKDLIKPLTLEQITEETLEKIFEVAPAWRNPVILQRAIDYHNGVLDD